MSKFNRQLTATSSEIKAAKAKIKGGQSINAAKKFVQVLEDELLRLQEIEADLNDFTPNSKDSLSPTSDSYDPISWFTKLNEVNVQMELLEVKLKIAKRLESEWFGEEEVETKAKK